MKKQTKKKVEQNLTPNQIKEWLSFLVEDRNNFNQRLTDLEDGFEAVINQANENFNNEHQRVVVLETSMNNIFDYLQQKEEERAEEIRKELEDLEDLEETPTKEYHINLSLGD